MLARISFAFVAVLLAVPAAVFAFPFGGQITVHHVCYNETIFARLSAPVPGDYVWTRSTKTYQFGPPRNVGQWLLGLTSIPYDCLWSVNPIRVQPAIAIMMMGSSGAAAPSHVPPPVQAPPSNVMQVKAAKSTKAPSATKAPEGAGTETTKAPDAKDAESTKAPDPFITNEGTSRVLITEVFFNVDSAHGTDPDNEWIEIYNGSNATVDLSGWTVRDDEASDTIQSGVTLAPGKYVLILASAGTLNYWPGSAGVTLGSLIGSGLSNSGDVLRLRTKTGTLVDSVSWGSNTSAFSPSVKSVSKGYSIARSPVTKDTNTADDWVSRAAPTPGK